MIDVIKKGLLQNGATQTALVRFKNNRKIE